MTVIAEAAERKIRNLHRFCPDVDIVGINTYGGIASVRERYVKAGGSKPYVVAEFGPPGHWETGSTPWGAPYEMTSTAKAKWYLDGYQKGIAAHPGFCLGSYVFVWGAKQEATATWYGLFLRDGARLAGVEAMTRAWGGKRPENRCPVIHKMSLTRSQALKPGDTVRASLEALDPDRDKLTVNWVLRRESGLYATGGDDQPDQPEYPDAIVKSGTNSAELRMPKSGGGYRLFAYVYDGKGNAAVANCPLHVEGRVIPPRASLPFIVYDEGQRQPYVPSGYMGNVKAISMDPRCKTQPYRGKTCLRVAYRAGDNWGGVVWQSPANDWGQKPGGYDLTGATALELWTRGEKGGETVSFLVGILGKDKAYPDSDKAEVRDLKLTNQWQRLRIPLGGRDLSCIKTGFGWTVKGQGRPIVFYLDDVRFVGKAE